MAILSRLTCKTPILSASLSAMLLFSTPSLFASYTLHKGRLIFPEEVPKFSVQEHYGLVMEAYDQRNWIGLIEQGTIIFKNFPDSPFAKEALFFLGIGYFELGDSEVANEYFSEYLKSQTTPRYFEETIAYKFEIARRYHAGEKRHVMGTAWLPRWVPAQEEALAMYDEVIAALPHHDVAAQALYYKGQILFKDGEYKSSIEAFQSLIRKFPKHILTPDAFVAIGEVYLAQCRSEYTDLDYLDLAEINLRKFRLAFPGDPRSEKVAESFLGMKEEFARNLLEIGAFYEKTKKRDSALIYYTKILATYPETKTADSAGRKMRRLGMDPDVYLQKIQKTERISQERPIESFEVIEEEVGEPTLLGGNDASANPVATPVATSVAGENSVEQVQVEKMDVEIAGEGVATDPASP